MYSVGMLQAEVFDAPTDEELAYLASWDQQLALRRMTVPALRVLAKERGIANTSRLKKKELISVLEKDLGLTK